MDDEQPQGLVKPASAVRSKLFSFDGSEKSPMSELTVSLGLR